MEKLSKEYLDQFPDGTDQEEIRDEEWRKQEQLEDEPSLSQLIEEWEAAFYSNNNSREG